MAFSETLKNLKEKDSPIYWVILDLLHGKGWEYVAVLEQQYGPEIEDTNLLGLITAYKMSSPDFPLDFGRSQTTPPQRIVRITGSQRGAVREAMEMASPEHMLPNTISVRASADEPAQQKSTQKIFIEFRDVDKSQSINLLSLMSSMLLATEGLSEIREIDQEEQLIVVNTLRGTLVIRPVRGRPEAGYYADRIDVLDLWDHSTWYLTGDLHVEQVTPILVSEGFALPAQRKATTLNPSVCLLPLWALITLLKYLQGVKDDLASALAFEYIHGQTKPSRDGHVHQTLEEFLKPMYPTK